MGAKIERLDGLWGHAEKAGVELHLVLCSPSGATTVHENGQPWPCWALDGGKPRHIRLGFGNSDKPLFQPRRTGWDGDKYREVEFIRAGRQSDCKKPPTV
jgi:hypothetical protein